MKQLDLTSAVPATGGTSFWKCRGVTLDLGEEGNVATAFVKARFVGANGEARSGSYAGQAAYNDIVALNKANLSTNSLHKRVLEKFRDLGELGAGTISGSDD